jgi:hypothetical protein
MVKPKQARKPGRPFAGGRDPLVAARLPTELTRRIDAWAKLHEVTRSEAMRQLLEQALSSKKRR